MLDWLAFHGQTALCRLAGAVLPLRIYPHIVAHLGLGPHCADLAQYRETKAYFAARKGEPKT